MPEFEVPPTPPPSPDVTIEGLVDLHNNFNDELARRGVHTQYLPNAAYTRATHSHRELWYERLYQEEVAGAYHPDFNVEIFEPGTPEPAAGREPALKRNNQRKRAAYKKLVSRAAAKRQRIGR